MMTMIIESDHRLSVFPYVVSSRSVIHDQVEALKQLEGKQVTCG